MSATDRSDIAGEVLRGRTTLSARALQNLAVGVAKDAASVGQGEVAVTLSDDGGSLRVSVVVPALITTPAMSIPDQSARVRARIIVGMQEGAGRRVRAVDVRFAGVRRTAERRVA
ncbi:hypothetical protein [Microbacterium sp. A93]|uniref:hypothetical protein n=1 Tax=Microbacterium sp. A93 TaxID=3450716 RepID=UPI003F41D2F4